MADVLGASFLVAWLIHRPSRLVAGLEGDGSVEVGQTRSQGLVCGVARHEYRRHIGYSVSLCLLEKIQVRGKIDLSQGQDLKLFKDLFLNCLNLLFFIDPRISLSRLLKNQML